MSNINRILSLAWDKYCLKFKFKKKTYEGCNYGMFYSGNNDIVEKPIVLNSNV